MKRKIEAMYERFGRSEGKCKDCIHNMNERRRRKYGMLGDDE